MGIELRILGPLRLTTPDAGELDPLLRQSKRIALLAYLCAAVPRGFHRRDRLLATFWPELDAARARSALNQALYILRSALGNDAISTRGDTEVRVVSDIIWCDAAAFEQALDDGRCAEAMALYRGDLLGGFFIQGAPEFERWLELERDRLRHRAADGAWTLAEASAREGHTIEAVRHARSAADLMPADEAVVRRLMRFLHRLGDRAAAIRAYEAFAWRLSADYDLEPSSETIALADAIRREAAHPVAIRLEKLLPSPIPRVLRRLERNRLFRPMLAASIALIAFGAGALSVVIRSQPPPAPSVRFALQSAGINIVTTGVPGSTIAISPANDRIAFLAENAQGTRLYTRSISDLEPAVVPHTRGAYLPFFSDDGKWLAFVGDGALRKISVNGGPAMTICAIPTSVFGASWGSTDIIVFATSDALWQVSATGGSAKLLAVADTAHGVRYRWPEILPGGKAAVFTRVDSAGFRLATITLATGAIQSLDTEGTHARFVVPSHIVFVRHDGALLAAPFDEDALTITGPIVPVVDGIAVGMMGAAKLGISRGGALAYVPEQLTGRTLALVDRRGQVDTILLPSQGYSTARLSADGRKIVADVIDAGSSSRDVWLFDLDRGTSSRVTSDSSSGYPQWSPDNSLIAFGTTGGGRDAGFSIRFATAEGGHVTETLSPSEHGQLAETFARDGDNIIFHRETAKTKRDIWILPLSGDRTPRPYLQTAFNERAAAPSPDGHWLAYVSDEFGRDEIYVRGFPVPGEPIRISDDGGREPQWSPSGRELFYRSGAGMISVAMTTSPGLKAGQRQQLFNDAGYVSISNGTAYDVHPDGNRFLMVRRGREVRQIIVVLNAFDRLRTGNP